MIKKPHHACDPTCLCDNSGMECAVASDADVQIPNAPSSLVSLGQLPISLVQAPRTVKAGSQFYPTPSTTSPFESLDIPEHRVQPKSAGGSSLMRRGDRIPGIGPLIPRGNTCTSKTIIIGEDDRVPI